MKLLQLSFNVVLSMVILSSIAIGAEKTDAMFLEYKYSFNSSDKFNRDNMPDQDVTSHLHNINAKVTIPLYRTTAKKPISIFTVFTYDSIITKYRLTEDADPVLNSIESLHAVKGALASYVPLGLHKGMFFSIAGGINTDLSQVEKIDSRDIVTSGNMIFNYKFNTVIFQYGIASTSNFGRPMILPVLGISYRPNSWFNFNCIIPYEISLWYLSEIFRSSLYARIKGNQYRLIREDEANNFTISFVTLETGFSIRYKIWKKLFIFSEGGIHPYRNLTIYNNSNSKTAVIDYSKKITEMLFIKFGIAYSAI